MSRVCEKCGRGPKSSQSRSHSNIASKRTQQINLQNTTIDGKRMRICTTCIKSANKK
ncbi:MAG: 50S ribosomal protein L28 [bacterium]|nr:50S ribosomal protein L28 [bacterium]